MARRAAKFPMTDFYAFLRSSGVAERSAQNYLQSIRRALGHIGPEHLTNVDDLSLYLLSMPKATRLTFRTAWSRLRAYAEVLGDPLPEIPRLPRTRLPHPLWADVTDMAVAHPVATFHLLRWQDLSDPISRAAAKRIFQFVTDRDPTPDDIVVPRHADAHEPMPVWALKAVMNTEFGSGVSRVGESALKLLEIVTRAGIDGRQLRELWAAIESIRTESYASIRIDSSLNGIIVPHELIDPSGSLVWTAETQKIFLGLLQEKASRESAVSVSR